MQRFQPLGATNPEFTVLVWPGFREYRVENWHLARNDSSRVIRGATGLTWQVAIVPVVFGFIWTKVESFEATIALLLSLVYLIWTKCTQVLFESVIVIPPHGIQLETHRGFPPSRVLFVSRRFIPMFALQDFVINEGLRRWDVRYYLTAIQKTKPNTIVLEVAYEHILPHFPVLCQVYQGVQEALFTDHNCAKDTTNSLT
jgi:phosphatidylinositol glycan class H protein